MSTRRVISLRKGGRAVHLLPAGEVSRQGCPSTSVAVCGEPVTSGSDSEDDPSYCPDCVREALRWCAQPGAGACGHPGGLGR
ncbi:MAG: hypothetical protein ACRDRA_11055 [Pseudonocardiaceae bacterium]